MLPSRLRTRSAPRNWTRFAAQYSARGLPCERFTAALASRASCITRGRGGWLDLPRGGLSPPILCQLPGALGGGSRRAPIRERNSPGKLVANLIYDCFFIAVDRIGTHRQFLRKERHRAHIEGRNHEPSRLAQFYRSPRIEPQRLLPFEGESSTVRNSARFAAGAGRPGSSTALRATGARRPIPMTRRRRVLLGAEGGAGFAGFGSKCEARGASGGAAGVGGATGAGAAGLGGANGFGAAAATGFGAGGRAGVAG
jgi:hypothetical protein